MEKARLMVVDNEKLLLQSLIDLLETQGYFVDSFLNAESALEWLKAGKGHYDIILTDINMPKMDGYHFIEEIRKSDLSDIKIIVLTGYGSINGAVKAVKLGADSYCQKDQDPELLLFEINKLEDQINLKKDLDMLQREAENNLIYLFNSSDRETLKVFEIAKKIASKDVNILITGESGTGKEILSRYIYNHSGVKGRFVSMNCSAIPDSLFESEMFGHVKGAFTGAHQDAQGFFAQAEGGILMLDEIGELLPMNQAKLLKVIEEHCYYPVGSSERCEANCRIIAATNQDLQRKIEDGSFRTDFYYRLNTVSLHLPPLRERTGDIMEFARIFINQFSRKYQTEIEGISPEAEHILTAYEWPGNIRQLRQTLERCVLFCSDKTISEELVSRNIYKNAVGHEPEKVFGLRFRDAKYYFEKDYFSKILDVSGYNINEVAETSGMNRTYIYKKLKELELI